MALSPTRTELSPWGGHSRPKSPRTALNWDQRPNWGEGAIGVPGDTGGDTAGTGGSRRGHGVGHRGRSRRPRGPTAAVTPQGDPLLGGGPVPVPLSRPRCRSPTESGPVPPVPVPGPHRAPAPSPASPGDQTGVPQPLPAPGTKIRVPPMSPPHPQVCPDRGPSCPLIARTVTPGSPMPSAPQDSGTKVLMSPQAPDQWELGPPTPPSRSSEPPGGSRCPPPHLPAFRAVSAPLPGTAARR